MLLRLLLVLFHAPLQYLRLLVQAALAAAPAPRGWGPSLQLVDCWWVLAVEDPPGHCCWLLYCFQVHYRLMLAAQVC